MNQFIDKQQSISLVGLVTIGFVFSIFISGCVFANNNSVTNSNVQSTEADGVNVQMLAEEIMAQEDRIEKEQWVPDLSHLTDEEFEQLLDIFQENCFYPGLSEDEKSDCVQQNNE